MTRPRLKICCVLDEAEAALAVAGGADAIGLVGPGLSGPEVRDEATIRRVAATVPAPVATFLLTRLSDPDDLVRQVQLTATTVVQLCDAVPREAWTALKHHCPWVRVLQVVHVSGHEAVDEARDAAPFVDGVLLDSGVPTGPNPVFGGTGRTHDWSISARVVRALDRPVWLAGGLHADNLADAWRAVRPFGLDLCSGARVNGRMDADRVAALGRAIRALD